MRGHRMTSPGKFVLTMGLLTGLLGNSAVGAYLDFTDSITLGNLSGSGSSYSGSIDGIGFSLTSVNGEINFTEGYDGDNPSTWCQPAGLACVKDGIGISNDEVTGENAQTLSLVFDVPVYIHSLEFLDLYDNRHNGKGREQATVNIDGTLFLVNADGTPGDGGYAMLDLQSLASPVQAIVFSANSLEALRDDNTNDYAFAAASVSAVPIPGAAWLFGAALLGLTGLGKRKSRIAS